MEIEYKGLKLKPIGNILGGWKVKTDFMTWAYKIIPDGYTHKDFYKIAKKHHCSVDVYEIDGKCYIPNDRGFIGLLSGYEKHLKPVSEYSNWYKWSR